MNILDVLREDHRKVIELFAELEDTEPDEADKRRRVFATLKEELLRHAHAEERIFYPRLKEHEESRDDTEEAIDEHKDVEQLLIQMEGMDFSTDDWMETLRDCRELVEHHVEEEESRLFSEADELIHDELDELGDRFEEEKKREQ